MTAILNFTLPNLDVPPGRAAASGRGLDLGAPESAGADQQGVSGLDNGKDFGGLVDSRIVKKETGKESNFDGSRETRTESADDGEELIENENAPVVLSQAVTVPSSNSSQQFGANPAINLLSAESGTQILDNTSKRSGTSPEYLATARYSETTGLSGGQTTGISSLDTSKSAPEAPKQTGPLANFQVRAPAIGDTATRQPDSLTTAVRPETQSLMNEPEAPVSDQARTLKPAFADIEYRRPMRPIALPGNETTTPASAEEAEFAALSGKELPAGGKPLPSVLLQTPAQSAPGLSGRAEFMTRSVGNGRQRSIGKDAGELPGLEKVAAANGRLPLSEMFAKAVNQVQPVVGTETGMHAQSTGSDSQATGLLAQAQAGVERVSGARAASQLTSPDSNNSFSLQLQPGSQEMSAQLGSRIRWMGNLNISSAELKLYPAELGTLEILITTEDDQARVNFVTSTTAAKEMIEASLPRLRELLGQSGMLLEQGDVTQRDLSKNNSDSATPVVEGPAAESLNTEALEQITPMYQRSASDHRIDHFA